MKELEGHLHKGAEGRWIHNQDRPRFIWMFWAELNSTDTIHHWHVSTFSFLHHGREQTMWHKVASFLLPLNSNKVKWGRKPFNMLTIHYIFCFAALCYKERGEEQPETESPRISSSTSRLSNARQLAVIAGIRILMLVKLSPLKVAACPWKALYFSVPFSFFPHRREWLFWELRLKELKWFGYKFHLSNSKPA